MKKTDIDKIIETLEHQNVRRSVFIEYMADKNDPFMILISCILSLRTKDETTYPATVRLFSLGKTPADFLKLADETIQNAIYPVGFYKNKTAVIKDICKVLVEKYNSQVPDDLDELLKLKGVGRKTANLVIAKGFYKPAICVDVHVHRICNRLGYVKTKTPDETEFALREKLPEKYWTEINELLVTHGQNTCRPVRPKCDVCAVIKWCSQVV